MLYIYGDHNGQLLTSIDVNRLMSVCYESLSIHDIINCNKLPQISNWKFKEDDVIIISLGEQDCRYHIKRNCPNSEALDNYIITLSDNYISNIASKFSNCKCVIILGIIPPTKKRDLLIDRLNHYGISVAASDEERINITNKLNASLEQSCTNYPHVKYVYPYQFCQQFDGSLNCSLSNKKGQLAIQGSKPLIKIMDEYIQNIYY